MNDEDKTLDQLEQELNAEASQSQPTPPSDGTESTNTAADSVTPEGEPVVEDSAALKAEMEALRKEKAKVEMERNLLRNKEKEAERERLSKVNKEDLDEMKAAYESLLAEKEEREAREAEESSRQQANDFRESVIAQRNEKVQAAAKALIAKNESNLAWTDAKDEADAAAQLNAQLDALESVLGVEPAAPAPEEPNPQVHANNPGRPPADKPFEDMTLEEMEKSLPWAPAR